MNSSLPQHKGESCITRYGYYKWKHTVRASFRCVSFVSFLAIFCTVNFFYQSGEQNTVLISEKDVSQGHVSRHLAGIFQDEADPTWLLAFNIIGVLYMFLALAIICDEFFVPALEEMSSERHLNLSNDIAGATLMAAGGSAPELFTSFIGTFQKSEVGFGTIVGSAVFNVLFVIGMCSIYSKDVLKLSWWPLFRDTLYYAVGLLVLAMFVGVVSPNEIEWWEALILFAMYFGYVLIMAYNRVLFKKITGEELVDPTEAKPGGFIAFRAGVIELLTTPNVRFRKLGVGFITSMAGDVDEAFDQVDKDRDGHIDKDELRQVLSDMNFEPSEEEVDSFMNDLDEDKNGRVDKKEFKVWFVSQSNYVKNNIKRVFDEVDTSRDGVIGRGEMSALLKRLAPQVISEDDITEAMESCYQSGSKDTISFEEFSDWYSQSLLYEKQKDLVENDGEVKQEESILENLSPKEVDSCMSYIRWLILIPLHATFAFTVPDVRRVGMGGYCYAAFVISICWIGVCSYFMVGWATTIGETLGIPVYIMGLTFLAAGTSVPDLLSSVIVATRGFGDMAVSSSIGSNIFDILVGLPVPWLAFTIYPNGEDFVYIAADGVWLQIIILLVMLVLIIVSIHLQGWKLTKTLGYFMFFFYFLFLAQALLCEYVFDFC